jgi:hypothetical protein
LQPFQGSRKHLVGGSLFSTILRYAIPFLKRIGKRAVSAGVRGGAKFLSGEKPLAQSMKEEFTNEAVDTVRDETLRLATKVQKGRGKKKIPKRLINKNLYHQWNVKTGKQ